MDRDTGAKKPITISRLIGAGLLLLMLFASSGSLTHATGSARPATGDGPTGNGTRATPPPPALARPGHRGTRSHRPSDAPAASVARPKSGECQLAGKVLPSANAGTGDNYLNEVTAVAANDLWSVGAFYNWDSASYQTLVEHWTDATPFWVVAPSPNLGSGTNQLYAIAAVAANDVWAAGYYYNMDTKPGHDATLIEHWDGSTWAVIPSPNLGLDNNDLYAIAAVSKGDVWAVGGYYDDATGVSQMLIEHWDGSAWAVVPSPAVPGGVSTLYSVDALAANDVWAVGEFYNTGDYSYHTLAEHWNGTAWAISPSLDLNTNNRYLYKVTALSATDVWAVGSTWDMSSIDRTLIEHWNGFAWMAVPSANVGTDSNNLYSIAAASATDMWAAGDYYDYVTDAYQTLVEHWDGITWAAVLSPNAAKGDNDLYGVAATSGTNVWVVGGYTDLNNDRYTGTGQTLTVQYSPGCPPPTSTPVATSTPTGSLSGNGGAATSKP